MTPAWKRLGRTACLTTVLAIPSTFLVETRLGDAAIAAYFVYVAALVWLWMRRGEALARLIAGRRALALAAVTATLVVALFFVVYPIANSGTFGPGSDCDEALDQATRALGQGRYPYLESTYLGNPITPMPGELLLVAPFVALGKSAYQTLFWMGVGALLLWRCFRRDTAMTLVFCWLVLAACPTVIHEIVTGGDRGANTLMVLTGAVLLVSETSPARRLALLLFAAVFFGVTLSSRANFVFIVPLVFSRLVQTKGVARALMLTALATATATAATLPFFLADPSHFTPLHTRSTLGGFDALLPHADLVLPLVAFVLALALSVPRWNRSTQCFLRNAAIVQGAFIACATCLSLALEQELALRYTSYGQFFLYFALGSVALREEPGSDRQAVSPAPSANEGR